MNSNFSVPIKIFIGTVILIVHILAMASLPCDVKFLWLRQFSGYVKFLCYPFAVSKIFTICSISEKHHEF